MRRLGELTGSDGSKANILKNECLNELLSTDKKAKVHIMALGDVGQNLLLGLKLLGGDVIGEIGLYDLNEKQTARLEIEMGQICYPPLSNGDGEGKRFPRVRTIRDEELTDCDLLIFCASRRVPAVGEENAGDVRMAQLELNGELIASLGKRLKAEAFSGMVCVVSDPVDPLCGILKRTSGLAPGRIRGFGLGVMNARACYYAEREGRFASYLEEGRVYGPHGADLVVANSIANYDDLVSRELTERVVRANLEVRALGYKPFLAPALSSGALSILAMLRGEWHYGSLWFGNGAGENDAVNGVADGAVNGAADGAVNGAYLGCLSRFREGAWEYEDLALPEKLYARIEAAYQNLVKIGAEYDRGHRSEE